MGSTEYWQGRDLEKNQVLHEQLQRHLNLDNIRVDGSTGTKGDTFGRRGDQEFCISIKNASGQNTQVHITTLKQFASQLKMPNNIRDTMDRWLGVKNKLIFQDWANGLSLSRYELGHNRIKSNNLPNWSEVETWVNTKNKDLSLPRLLIQGSDEKNLAQWLVWVKKKQGGYQVVDVNKLVAWIGGSCNWITMPSGTVLRCVTPGGLPILWLQMKGNREDGGHNHTPQFHIVENWPREFIIYEDTTIRF